MMRPPTEAASLVPNSFAASFTFEKANCLSLLRIEELMGLLKISGARGAVKKTVPLRLLVILIHAPPQQSRR
jgi:hypothetical protein